MTTKVKPEQFKAVFECSLTQKELQEQIDAPLGWCRGLGKQGCMKTWGEGSPLICCHLRLLDREEVA